MNAVAMGAPAPRAHRDELERRWLIAVYASLLVPFIGGWILVLGSSVLYYAWRAKTPRRASQLNRHAWTAWGIGLAIHLTVIAWRHGLFA